jgi:cholesterol oxidase
MTATVRFTEEMLGHVTFGEADFELGPGHRDGAGALMFHLTIEVPDIDALRTDPLRAAGAVGYLRCDALGGQLPVERGVSTCSSTPSPASSACSTGCGSATASATR